VSSPGERAAGFRRRQEQREELCVEYSIAVDVVDEIDEDAEEESLPEAHRKYLDMRPRTSRDVRCRRIG